jgi:predicted O-methyltransferase YrrM
MNKNEYDGFGNLYSAYLIGKCSEYCQSGDLFEYVKELIGSSILKEYEHAVRDVEDWQTKSFNNIWSFRLFRILIYALIRDLKPKLVVETGVLHGMTSGFILLALNQNTKGKLISYDLPSTSLSEPANLDGYFSALPQGKKPGWIIPPKLLSNWKLRLGPSLSLLKADETELEQIDIFCHDSEHSYETMWGELNFAWERISNGGLLICDNIEANPSLFDFCRKVNRLPLVLPAPNENVSYAPRFAIIKK